MSSGSASVLQQRNSEHRLSYFLLYQLRITIMVPHTKTRITLLEFHSVEMTAIISVVGDDISVLVSYALWETFPSNPHFSLTTDGILSKHLERLHFLVPRTTTFEMTTFLFLSPSFFFLRIMQVCAMCEHYIVLSDHTTNTH